MARPLGPHTWVGATALIGLRHAASHFLWLHAMDFDAAEPQHASTSYCHQLHHSTTYLITKLIPYCCYINSSLPWVSLEFYTLLKPLLD